MKAELTRILQRLQEANELDLVALISMDGLVIDSASPIEVDVQQIAATACNGLLMARAMGGELGRGLVLQVILEYQNGLLMLVQLDEDLGLAMLGPKDVNLGRMRLVARRYVHEIVEAANI